MAAFITQQAPSAPPRGLFAFFKDGVVVPARNRGLFLPLVALHAARSTAFFFAKTLALRFSLSASSSMPMPVPMMEAYDDGVGNTGLLFALVGKCLADGRCHLLHAGAAYLLAHVTLGLAIYVVTVTAAVAASCSGEGRHTTLASLLAKVKGNLRGPMATAVFVETVGWALVGVVLLVVPAVYLGPGMALAVLLFQMMALPFVLFCDVVCKVAIVGSVAEPGLRTAAAAGRARGLMRGGRKVAQAMLYSLLVWALDKAIWKMHAVTMARCSSLAMATAPFLLEVVILYLLLGALKVLGAATVTAYYLDCRRTEEEKAGHAE